MPLGTDADITRRLGGAPALLRLFDRDRDGVVDSDLVTAAKEYAEAEIYAALGASHPGVVFDDPGPVPALIRDIWARLAIAWMAEALPGFTDAQRAPYAGMKKSALEALQRIATNNGVQLPSGTPQPYAGGAAYVYAPATVWGPPANGSDPDQGGGFSGF